MIKVRNQEVNIIDLTSMQSCIMFRQLLDSASDADTQYRSQDQEDLDEDGDWDSDEESNTTTTGSSWKGVKFNDNIIHPLTEYSNVLKC
jgi:hypothetical protein